MLIKICPDCIQANMFPDAGEVDAVEESWKEPPVLNKASSSYFCVGGWDVSLHQSVCM